MLREVTYRTSGRRSVTTSRSTAGYGASEFDACALESGLYDASDMLPGDHLCDKSCTVDWLDVSMPHARRRRLKNHKQVKELEELDPGSENVFMDNLIGNHYPDGPQNLYGVCLHDFVTKYTACGKDKSGHKTYTGSFKRPGL